jgi:hypothetical protein
MAVSATFYNKPLGTGRNANPPGALFEGDVEITLGMAYATSGLTIAQLTVGLPLQQIIHFVPVCLGIIDGTLNNFAYDRANGKVLFYNGSTEVGNGVDLSAYKLYARVCGNR